MNQYLAAILAFLAPLAESILQRFAQGLWDAVWEEILRAVADAERQWEASGQGKAKKQWAMEQIMRFIDERAKLNWLERMVVQLLVSKAIDAIVDTANEKLGKNWVERVKDMERKLAAVLPLVE